MRIGYACLVRAVQDTALKTCILRNATEERLTALVAHNLSSLENMLHYNHSHGIELFRISSELIPFGSSDANTLDWGKRFFRQWERLAKLVREYGIRVSMHPGQYTILNSPDKGVVERAVADLRYHEKVLDLLHTGPQSKIILHVGGLYGDRESALARFLISWAALPASLKARIVLENDERCYHIGQVLELCERLRVPAVFDNLHHSIFPPGEERPEEEWVERARRTWQRADGVQKLHYSQQSPGGRVGAHSDTIEIEPFLDFCRRLRHKDTDIMLEVKDKNLSALRCMDALNQPDT